MVKKSLHLMLTSVCLLNTVMVHAEDAPVTLHSLTDTVYIQAPGQLAEQSLQQLSDAHQAQSGSLFAGQPTFRLSHFNDTLGSDNGLQEWESAIEAPLWLPGQKRHQANLSRHQAAQIPYYLQQLRLEASGQVRHQVWQVMLAAATYRQAQWRVEAAQTLSTEIAQGVADNLFSESELHIVRNHLAMMQTQHVEAQAQLQAQLNQFQYLTGASQLPETVEETLIVAQEISPDHPLLALYGQQIATLRSAVHTARYENAQAPSVSLGIKRERWQFGEPFNNSLGVGVSVPIGGERHRQTAAAEKNHELAELEIERQQVKQQLELQLLSLQGQLISQQNRQDLLRQQLNTYQPYLEQQQASFENGGIDLTTLIQSQMTATDLKEQIQLLEIQQQQTIAAINQTLGQTL